MSAPNVEFMWNSAIDDYIVDKKIVGAKVKNLQSGEVRDVNFDGLFVSIGRKPATDLFAGQLALDEGGYIIADESTKTSIDGVYAAGDVRTKTLRQVVTAVSDGAIAADGAEQYIALAKN
jgi:thioredoxin reductase (NADPH)